MPWRMTPFAAAVLGVVTGGTSFRFVSAWLPQVQQLPPRQQHYVPVTMTRPQRAMKRRNVNTIAFALSTMKETTATGGRRRNSKKRTTSRRRRPPVDTERGDDDKTTSSAARNKNGMTRMMTRTTTTATQYDAEQQDRHEVSSSSRLTKAKLLLEELTLTDEETAAAYLLNDVSSSSSSTSSSSSKSVAGDAAVVPDTFWRNDHLLSVSNDDGADAGFVTRWAGGVKVAEPLVKYDPDAAAALLFRQPAKWLLRNFQIAVPLGFWAAGVAADYVLTAGRLKSRQRRSRARQLTAAITNLGPAIIKGGQALSSRPDLLPSEYLEELQLLQDKVPTFSNAVAFATVEEELDCQFDDVFELVQEEPVAAASIGQVYKARLTANGDVVAVKIQRPACEEIIALDLYVLRWWCGVYNGVFRLLNRDVDLQSVIDDFGDLIYREIDYVAEAANAQRFSELYAGVKDVYVPKIYSDLTTSKVLTMEWVDGVRLTDRDALRKYNLDETRLVNTLVECSLKQILENGFFHADPHGGNLLATIDTEQLAFLDFGMVSYADAAQRNGFLLAVVHIVNRDWHELVQVYRKLGFIPEGTDLRPIEVALERALPDVLSSEISQLNFKNVINQLGDIMYTYPFSLPPFYIAIIRCLGVLEGVAMQTDPTARIISKAYPYVASRVLTDDSQDDIQEALRRLALTADGRHIRWDRLEGLLEQASMAASSEYDVTAALNMLSEYLLTAEGDTLLQELSTQIVDAADKLGSDTAKYITEAARALAIDDEVAAVRAFQNLAEIFQTATQQGSSTESDRRRRWDGVREKVNEDLRDVLPELTPSMKRFGRIASLLTGSATGANAVGTSTRAAATAADPAKFIPVIRKLAAEPRVRRAAAETVARLGERFLSRSLRAAFGLPPPRFVDRAGTTTTGSGSGSVLGGGSGSSSRNSLVAVDRLTDRNYDDGENHRAEMTVTEEDQILN